MYIDITWHSSSFAHLFCQVTSARTQENRPSEGTFLVLESSYHLLGLLQSKHSKEEAILLSALPKDTTSKLASLFSHYPVLMLNVKQGSCDYQLWKYFGLNRLRGKCSNHLSHMPVKQQHIKGSMYIDNKCCWQNSCKAYFACLKTVRHFKFFACFP